MEQPVPTLLLAKIHSLNDRVSILTHRLNDLEIQPTKSLSGRVDTLQAAPDVEGDGELFREEVNRFNLSLEEKFHLLDAQLSSTQQVLGTLSQQVGDAVEHLSDLSTEVQVSIEQCFVEHLGHVRTNGVQTIAHEVQKVTDLFHKKEQDLTEWERVLNDRLASTRLTMSSETQEALRKLADTIHSSGEDIRGVVQALDRLLHEISAICRASAAGFNAASEAISGTVDLFKGVV
jgi:hypothetical protein